MVWNGDGMILQVVNRLVIEFHLPMAGKMFEMGFDHRFSLPDNGLHHGFLIVGYSFSLDDTDRSFGAGAYAGPETIAEEITYEPCLSINELKCSLRAVRDALPASRAFGIVDIDYLPFHTVAPGKFIYSLFFTHCVAG
jgi:hypothetical protein